MSGFPNEAHLDSPRHSPRWESASRTRAAGRSDPNWSSAVGVFEASADRGSSLGSSPPGHRATAYQSHDVGRDRDTSGFGCPARGNRVATTSRREGLGLSRQSFPRIGGRLREAPTCLDPGFSFEASMRQSTTMTRIASSPTVLGFHPGPESCELCGAPGLQTELVRDPFIYGAGADAVELTAEFPVHTCSRCEVSYTGGPAPLSRTISSWG